MSNERPQETAGAASYGNGGNRSRCPRCSHDAPTRDHLADHLTDAHDAFTPLLERALGGDDSSNRKLSVSITIDADEAVELTSGDEP